MGQYLESRDISAPTLQQILHTTMVMYCAVLVKNDTMLQQFQLIPANSQPQLTLQK
jgi:hypothetical protein